ncbi:tRNA dihydrouridine synthase A [Klebsiella michiganensis]|nr:tRNA dihydrouridine synthase A [Klebsiella michiganensis]
MRPIRIQAFWRRWIGKFFGVEGVDADPVSVVRAMYPYIERELSNGTYLGHVTRHMLGLFQGSPARASGVAI